MRQSKPPAVTTYERSNACSAMLGMPPNDAITVNVRRGGHSMSLLVGSNVGVNDCVGCSKVMILLEGGWVGVAHLRGGLELSIEVNGDERADLFADTLAEAARALRRMTAQARRIAAGKPAWPGQRRKRHGTGSGAKG
jgi:hypothetical protein